jgi:uncharacterized RDD family membrane protein YckC
LALVIDTAILAVAGAVLGAFLGPSFARLGAKLVGLVVALAYFSLLNSRLTGGRTLGKRVLVLRVVRSDGMPPPLPSSLCRSLVLLLPFSIGGGPVPVFEEGVGETLLVAGSGGAFLYLYLFNRPTRQSLHDLICRTLVIDAKLHGPLPSMRLARRHLALVATWLSLLVIIVIGILPRYVPADVAAELETVRSRLRSQPGIAAASIVTGRSSGPTGSTRWIRVVVVAKETAEMRGFCLTSPGSCSTPTHRHARSTASPSLWSADMT